MKLQIDIPHRYACMRAHTATHLLHAELGKIFPQTKQAGSYVGPDELRFDFFAERSLTAEELYHISIEINNVICDSYPVSVAEMSYEDAIKTGAKAFFEDTYPEIVRVVSIGTGLSVELCGGTHVSDTSQIGSFFITEQTAVAAGVKRIVALTGPKVATHAQVLQHNLDQIANKISVSVKQLDAKIEKILAESEVLNTQVEKLTVGVIKNLIRTAGKLSTYNCDGVFDFDKDIASLGISFSEVVNCLKSLAQNRTWLLTTTSGQYALFHPKAKQIAQELGLKGGGSDMFFQGRDENIVSLITS